MASGGFDLSTSNPYVKGRVNWSSTANTNENYSNVYVEMRFSRTNSGYTTYGSGTFGIYLEGQQVVNTTRFTITQNSNTLVVSGTVRINHNADGTKNFRIGASGYTDVFSINDGSTTAYMDNIPRASTISSNISWTAALEGLPITVNRASSAFMHTIKVQMKNPVTGGWRTIADRNNIGDSTTVYFDKNEMTIIYTELAGWENTQVWVKLDTYNGGTFVGSTEKYGTVYGATPATPVISDFVIGATSVPQTLDYYYDTFNYTLTFTLGSFTKSFPNATKFTPLTFNSAEIAEMYKQVTTLDWRQAEVYASTKYNGVEINDGAPKSQTTKITVFVRNSEPVYNGGFTYLDTNTTTTNLTGNNQYIVQGKSKLQIVIPASSKATPVNAATMSYYDVTVNGVTKRVDYATTDIKVDFGEVNAASNATATVTAIDSRGFKTSASSVILMLPYSPPNISASADRLNNFENSTTIKLSGSYSPLTIGTASKNSITSAKFQRRQVGGSYDANGTPFTITGTPPNFVATNATVSLDNTLAWEILITVTDKVGSTVTTTRTVAVGTPIFFIDTEKNSVGVNKFPAQPKSAGYGLEIAGHLDVDGIIKVKQSQYITSASGAGLQLANSDISGANGIFFNDPSDGAGEGINFIKTGKTVGSTNMADYDNFCIIDNNVKINNKTIFSVFDQTSNIRMIGDMYSYQTGGAIWDVWGNIKGQPTGTSSNTWSIKDADDRLRFLTGIGKSTTAPTELYAWSGGLKFYHEGYNSWNMWQSGGGAYCHFDMGAGRMKWNGDNATFEFLMTSGGWAKVTGTWVTPSAREYKKNIERFEESALLMIANTPTYKYHYVDDNEYLVKKHLGLIVDETPIEIRGSDDKSIDTYAMSTLLWKAVQELYNKVDNLDRRITMR